MKDVFIKILVLIVIIVLENLALLYLMKKNSDEEDFSYATNRCSFLLTEAFEENKKNNLSKSIKFLDEALKICSRDERYLAIKSASTIYISNGYYDKGMKYLKMAEEELMLYAKEDNCSCMSELELLRDEIFIVEKMINILKKYSLQSRED